VALGVAALSALAVPGLASAKDPKVNGVRAELTGGTLDVKGNGHPAAVALHLAPGDPSRIKVDVDGSTAFTFAHSDVTAIAVEMTGGDDSVRIDDSFGPFTDSIPTTVDGGAGDDTLIGGHGAEMFVGGAGEDTVDGNQGNDTAFLGQGDDIFVWDPGDGSDSIEGEVGSDTMLFNGANVGEVMTATANGQRLRFTRNVGNVTMDTDGVETVDVNALGGNDNVIVDDLTGTDVTQTNVDLAGAGTTAGDGANDTVFVNGTDGDDTVTLDRSAADAEVTGLATAVAVTRADTAGGVTDTLDVDVQPGNDRVSVNGIAGALRVLIDGTSI
jgi:hypothetical protein